MVLSDRVRYGFIRQHRETFHFQVNMFGRHNGVAISVARRLGAGFVCSSTDFRSTRFGASIDLTCGAGRGSAERVEIALPTS